MSNVIDTAKTIAELSARTIAAGQARIDQHASGHLSRMAEQQSLRIVAAAQADLAQRACERWIETIYDGALQNVWWNVRDDHLIKLAPPWSRSRRTSYGLSEAQSRLLRRIVVDLVDAMPERRQLYWYVPEVQRWFLNRRFFPTVEGALEWQRGPGEITAVLWYSYGVRHPGGR